MTRNFLQMRSLKPEGVAGFRDIDAADRYRHVCVQNLQADRRKIYSHDVLDYLPHSDSILDVLLQYTGSVERYRLASLSFRRKPYDRSLRFHLRKRTCLGVAALCGHRASDSMAGLYNSAWSGLAASYSYCAWHILAALRSPARSSIVALRSRLQPGAVASGYDFSISSGFR